MKHLLLATFLAFLPMLVAAEEYTVEDFAFGYILETDDQGSIYSLSLPHEVYTGTVTNDLEDIRVFNSQGQVVPHEIRYPVVRDKRLMISDPMPFFPLFSKNNLNDAELSMRIETGSNGEIVNIQRNRISPEDTPSAYLIDMNNAETYPLSLSIQWTSEGNGILIPVTLESSEDLVSWRRVKKSTLADLIFMNNRLQHGKITLQEKPGRYLRLKSQNGVVLPKITTVQTLSSPAFSEDERRWIKLHANLYQKDKQSYLQAEIPTNLPITGLNIVFNQPNSLLKVRVLGLDSENVWRYRGEGLFYLLTNNDSELRSEPLVLQRQDISALRLEIIEDGVGKAFDSIQLQVGYVPQELLFIARGKGPFTLAYGNGKMINNTIKNTGEFLNSLAENGQQSLLRKADIREKVILGGEKLLDVTTPKPWNKIVLWLVLIAGVATLAVMAWSLTRKMNH